MEKMLAKVGVSIAHEDALMLIQHREALLAEFERVEFGTPAVVAIAEALASSSCCTQPDVAGVLATLQGAFYAIRDELPVDVPDAEIIEALVGCLNAWDDASEVATMPWDEVMAFSDAYVEAREAEGYTYRIADEQGKVYSFDASEWDEDEQADGWDGERWSDDWND